MNRGAYRFLLWLPRLLGILLAVFLASEAINAFRPESGWTHALAALAVHLAPVAAVLFALLLAWRWEGLGSACFVVMGALYAVYGGGRAPWSAPAVVSIPMLLIGI